MSQSTKELIQATQNNSFTEFEAKTTEILNHKMANKLNDLGYFKELDIAQGKTINSFNENEGTYKEFYKKTLKKFGVSSPAELDDDKKKEFFNAIQDGWKSEEKTEGGK